jgi:hypothetical protein
LIQKTQISIFRKGLNSFEFKNVFDLDLNLGFKFKSAAKIFQKHFHVLLAAQNRFWPTTPCSPPVLFSFSLILFSAGPVSFSAQCAQPTRLLAQFQPYPLLSSSFGHPATAVGRGAVAPCTPRRSSVPEGAKPSCLLAAYPSSPGAASPPSPLPELPVASNDPSPHRPDAIKGALSHGHFTQNILPHLAPLIRAPSQLPVVEKKPPPFEVIAGHFSPLLYCLLPPVRFPSAPFPLRALAVSSRARSRPCAQLRRGVPPAPPPCPRWTSGPCHPMRCGHGPRIFPF